MSCQRCDCLTFRDDDETTPAPVGKPFIIKLENGMIQIGLKRPMATKRKWYVGDTMVKPQKIKWMEIPK